jgi:uroporphyrinogen decarboxylase
MPHPYQRASEVALYRPALFHPSAGYGRIAGDQGKKMFMHSDGHIAAIYPDLIEVGIDALNSQLFCMDLAELARIGKGRITFWGEIDRQRILPRGSPAEVRAAVAQVVEHLWSPAGGCIAQFEFTAETPLANAEAVYLAWEELSGSLIAG